MSDLMEKFVPFSIKYVEANTPEQARKLIGAPANAECKADMPGRYNSTVWAVKVTG